MSSTTTTSTYDYSALKVNNVTPTSVKVNNTDCYRMKVNNTDVIHEDTTTTTEYDGTYTVELQYQLKITNYATGSDCDGTYSDGKAQLTITPTIVSQTGDIIAVDINQMKSNQIMTFEIGTSGETVTIPANTTGSSFTKTWTWDYNYGSNVLTQKNARNSYPIALTTTGVFDAAIGISETEENSVSVAGTSTTNLISFYGNGTYTGTLGRYTVSASATNSETTREY